MLPEITPELTPEQIQQLEDARKLLPKLKAEIRKAEAAGIDLTAQKAELTQIEANLDKLYRVYVSKLPTSFRP